MKVAIIYDSKTGNTQELALAIKESCKAQDVVYIGKPKDCVEADLYFIGSWTDKGSCSESIGTFCRQLRNEKVVIFATAGFGCSKEYTDTLYQRFIQHLDSSNKILGHFYCMGKMPLSVRDRYISMLQEHPEDKKLEVSVKNFDDALSHPNDKDLEELKEFVENIFLKIYNI